MALTLFRDQKSQLSQDAALTKLVGEGCIAAKKDTTNYLEGSSIFKVVANLASDDPVNLGGVTTGKYIRVETDQEITIKLSGIGNTAITINVPSTSINGVFEATVDYTEIHFANASGTDANVTILIAGI